ncbi:MAG: glycosyltransferase family 2 protein [Candidatus Sericytochromatia bacterium]
MELISVIIPVYNEEKHLNEVFSSIDEQNYPKEFTEIIFVDGNSQDQSIKLLKEYASKKQNIHIYNNEKKIVPISMNIGIKNSNGKYVIRLDSHSKYNKDYLSKCVEVLQKTNAENVGGAIRLIGELPVQKAIKLATTCAFGIGNSGFHYEDYEGYVESVYLGAYRKDILEKIGMYDEELVRNQDDELNYRLIKSGGKIFMSKEIISYYYPRPSLKRLWKQYYEYGYWRVRVIQKHKFPASIRQLIPAIFVTSIILGIILLFFKGLGLLILLPLIFLYTPLMFYFSIKQAIKYNFYNIFLTSSVFLILHFSYGTGFLKGVLDFYFIKKLN